jgi:hypothetical protein
MTARTAQAAAKEKGEPWTVAKCLGKESSENVLNVVF